MKINDPPIILETVEMPQKAEEMMKMKMHKYYSECFQVIDGFDKEGKPCFIVMNQPKICNGSFAGIKPSVIIVEKMPEGMMDTDLIDLKSVTKCSFIEEIPEQKPSNLYTYNFKVQRNILYNTLSELPSAAKNTDDPELKLTDRISSSSSKDDDIERDFN